MHAHLLELFVDGAGDFVPPVAGIAEVHAGYAVDVLPARGVGDVDAVGILHDHRAAVLGKLRGVASADEEVVDGGLAQAGNVVRRGDGVGLGRRGHFSALRTGWESVN